MQLEVVDYLRQNSIQKLQEEFGIKIKEYGAEGLVVLNYDQILSPKTAKITSECRGLILSTLFYDVVCRPFDRFFNYGEAGVVLQNENELHNCEVFEKVDGSLIKVYYFDGSWRIGTRGTAFAETEVNGFEITFESLVLKALGFQFLFQFSALMNYLKAPRFLTFLFELTSLQNRVVTRYGNEPTLWYLNARHKTTGEYFYEEGRALASQISSAIKFPVEYSFSSVSECVTAAKELPSLKEGYVLYHKNSKVPFAKIKSPAYCAVHLIRGEGLNPKRTMELVLTNEQEEYLSYFPEDRSFVEVYSNALSSLLTEMQLKYNEVKDIVEQKEFACTIKELQYSSILFRARKNKISTTQAFYDSQLSLQLKLLESCVSLQQLAHQAINLMA